MKKYRVKREVSILAFLRNRLKVRMAEFDFI